MLRGFQCASWKITSQLASWWSTTLSSMINGLTPVRRPRCKWINRSAGAWWRGEAQKTIEKHIFDVVWPFRGSGPVPSSRASIFRSVWSNPHLWEWFWDRFKGFVFCGISDVGLQSLSTSLGASYHRVLCNVSIIPRSSARSLLFRQPSYAHFL